MIYLFQGMDEYVATPDKAFEFPAMWILIFLCGNALTLTYPLRDLEGVGQQLLIRSGRRRHWWLAKCGWEIVSSVVYLLLLWLGVLCYCAIFQIPITDVYKRQSIRSIRSQRRNSLRTAMRLIRRKSIKMPLAGGRRRMRGEAPMQACSWDCCTKTVSYTHLDVYKRQTI